MNAQTLRSSKSELLAALQKLGAETSRPAAIRCPFHDDSHPSSGVYEDAGVWRFKCHGCGFLGDVFDVLAKLNNSSSKLEYAKANGQEGATKLDHPPATVYPSLDAITKDFGNVEAVYTYTNPDTSAPEMSVIRWRDTEGNKKFIQCHPTPAGWIKQAPPKPWPIYNRKRVAGAPEVFVVEGEKCVHALQRAGYIATTNPGGAGKAKYADWSMLAGKTVYLWPDNDHANDKGVRTGIAHMRDVMRVLEEITPRPRIMWIDPDRLGLPDKGDAADFLAAGRIMAEVINVAASTGASAEVKQLIDDTASGRRRSIEWPWKPVGQKTRALLPQTITLLCGDPGSAKSFLLMQAAIHWHAKGLNVALLELEETRRWHMLRALAICSGAKMILDDEWVREHADEASFIAEEHEQFIDSFGQCVHEGGETIDYDGVVKWIAARAESGCRIIAVDPITAVTPNEKPWIADGKFVREVKQIVDQFECSVILVTHPKKGGKGASMMEDMAGGAAYSRFSQTILWLEHHIPRKECTVQTNTAFGRTTDHIEADRTMKILKARNGDGTGMEMAFVFEGDKLSFNYCGVVVKDN